jgi:hypothetical protein
MTPVPAQPDLPALFARVGRIRRRTLRDENRQPVCRARRADHARGFEAMAITADAYDRDAVMCDAHKRYGGGKRLGHWRRRGNNRFHNGRS